LIKDARFVFVVTFFLFSFSFYHSYAQQLKGKIKDDQDQPIGGINVLIKKKPTDHQVFKYAISDDNGYYSISLDSTIDAFFVEFKSLAYTTKTIEISGLSKKPNPYILNVILENDLTKLEEVIVKSEKRPITVKNDTTSYDLSKFKDGTEKVIEDLIRKLPGIKVKENGKITFKGKDVESLLLDGDDLFDSNYTIGTKNIDVDMVDGLSAIENYTKNPLLNGIANTEAVALNLQLKAGKTDFSNTTNLGLGIESKTDINTNLLGVAKKHKSFSTASFNNIGKEYSPYNSFSPNNSSSEDYKQDDLEISKIIQDGDFNSPISEERSRIGNNLFTSINSIINFTKNVRGKINLDYKNDNLQQSITNRTDYIDINNSIDFFQQETAIKNVQLFNIKLDLDYNLSETKLLESKTKFRIDDSNIFFDLNLNDSFQKSLADSQNKQIHQTFNFTKKLNGRSAFTGELLINKSELSQNLFVSPDLRFPASLDIYNSNQTVAIEKTNLNFNAAYLQSGKDYNLKIGTGITYAKTDLFSVLKSGDMNTIFSTNDLKYITMYPWLDASLFYKLNKWSFRPSFQTKYLTQKLANQENISDNNKVSKYQFLPRVNISYSFDKISNITFMARYDEKLLTENRLYEGVIFTSNRVAQKNTASLTPLKSYNFDLSYNYNDFFNLLQFSTVINYSVNKNNYFDQIEIDSLFTLNSNRLFDESSRDMGLSANIDKYIGFLKSNVRLNVSYNIGTFRNIINNSGFRENTISSILSELNIRTGFLGIINFENNFQYQKSIYHSMEERNIQNTAFQNSLKLHLNPHKQLRVATNFDYYVPDVNNFQSYIFFDTSVTFTSNNGKIDYSLISKNITPYQSAFSNTVITDYSVSTFSYRIQRPYLLFSVSFKL
jgi:hypothetical protein